MSPVEHPVHPEEIMEYLDGEMVPDRAAAVKAHVEGCAECQAVSNDLERVSHEVAAWRIESAPGTLRAPGSRVIGDPVRASWRPRWLPAWAAYSIAGGAVAAILLLAFIPSRYRADGAPAVIALGGVPPDSSESTRRSGTPGSSAGAVQPPEPVPFGRVPQGGVQGAAPRQPRIVRTATVRLVAKDFDAARAALDRIMSDAGGFLGELDVSGARPSPRVLNATLRIPVARLDATVNALKSLGELTEESRGADDVTEQALDIEARLANGRNTEKRLNDLLQTRTGKLTDVLEAEREIARVRQEIEQLDAQRRNLETRVTYATVTLHVAEARTATLDLGPLPLSGRLGNATVDGVRTAFEGAVMALLVLLRIGPTIALWSLPMGALAYLLRRRAHRARLAR